MMRRLLNAGLVVLAAVLAVGQPGRAQETTLSLDPEKTTVSFTLEATLHTVHGTFRLKSGAIRFDPSTGAANGTVVIDAASGQTWNKRRDHTMHRDVLQSERYPEVTFTPTRVAGNILPQGESSVQVEGVLRLLGTDHAITLPFLVQASGSELRATTRFVIPYAAWGLKNPSTFFLHVADKVELSIAASGKLTSAATQR
ncbi:MAG TPA: YceI family protein [Terriglobales bacterium]|nr:YceI family protein [Terriglobales bacterium]